MSELSKYFDEYSFNARVKPALFLVFPIFISLLVLFEPVRTWEGSGLTFLVAFGIINFAANQMSSKGNELQENLFKKWGGAPTTIILRHFDNTLDSFTKSRYMEKLRLVVQNFSPTTYEYERLNPAEADALYASASNYLREHTRDTAKYNLLFKENISYGFSRNIRSFKIMGIFITLASILGSLLAIYFSFLGIESITIGSLVSEVPFEYVGLIIIHLSMLWAWVFLVTEKWVRTRAFAYAKRLYSACEQIKRE
ncbi:hypothetical protein [Marinobacter gelidimuriae]|uniref:hypothetical protein n=1 Tax=Marinobacter gelidimuriae TaxID=2739064 RepID=UPI00037808DA|nr:hypothetical protein [Marinobacter gelidimuriae]